VDDLSGQTLKGYDITERIGIGSFGAVYRARQTTVGREVAIKAILPEYANRPEFVRRFESEARLIARLEHPHIVPLFDYWREPDRAYLVMRLLPDSLRMRLSAGPLSPEEASLLVDQIASALTMSHRQGIAHRDIKPDNILLDAEGNAYLSDFGLAQVIGLEGAREGVAGSPGYMSPEQLKGETITAQADIYAMGIVIYEMLAADHPLEGLSMSEVIRRQLLEPLPRIHLRRDGLPQAVDYVIQRATAKNPDERYPDMLALAADLRNALLGEKAFYPMDDDAAIDNPYKGLRAFEEADAGDFFGREALVSRLIGSLDQTSHMARFLAVVGPSGCGKSSLVYAGLIPALRQGALPGSERWFVARMVPSRQPIKKLETALLSVAVKPVPNLLARLQDDPDGLVWAADQILAETEGDLLLIIDQFEELFTFAPDERERLQFMALLQSAASDLHSRARVIVMLRADFYDRPLLYERFGALMQARTHIVLPLSESELERAITAPAHRVSVQLEPNLTAAIIADVRQEPGALPLMQYALTEVFERRQGRLMTLEGYEAIGRAAGALARRADRVYTRLKPEQQVLTRQMFLRLVTLGDGSEDVRRRAHRAELLSIAPDSEQLETVLAIFGRHRLLSFDHEPATREPTVEVAHEALLREWKRLRSWLDDSREDVRQQRRLAGLAAEWLNNGRDPSFVLRGAQLETFESWLKRTGIALTGTERDFVEASVTVRERQNAEEKARQDHEAALEARARQFQRRLAWALAVAALVGFILSFVALQQRQQAQSARDDAQQNAEIAQTQAAAAATAAAVAGQRADTLQSLALASESERALVDRNDYDLALALAVEANLIPNAPAESQYLLGEIVPTATLRLLSGHAASVNTVAISPDSATILSGADDGTLILWDAATGGILRQWTGHEGRVRDVAFLPDGTRALSGGDDDVLVLWDTRTGQPVRTFTGHDDDVFAVAVSPDGTQALSGSRDRTLILWDIETGHIVRRYGQTEGHDERVTTVTFSPDGTMLLSGSADHSLILWDRDTGAIIDRLAQHRDIINDVAFSPDGARFLSASADNTLILWDTQSRAVVNRLQGHTERVSSVAFSPDGRMAVSGAGNQFAGASTDNTLILWDLQLGQPVRRYQGHTLFVSDLAFSPDGTTIVSASADQTLRLWPATYDIELARQMMPDVGYNAVGLDPARQRAFVALADNRFFLQTLAPGAASAEFLDLSGHTGAITALAINADGTRMLSASADRTAILWDLTNHTALHTLAGHTNTVNSVAFSPDGTRALTGSRDRSMILWDLTTGESIRAFAMRHTNSVDAVAFSPDGKRALSASADHTLMLWDVDTGEALLVLRGHQDQVTSVDFGPDGAQALSGSVDKTLILWDLQTGQIVRRFGVAGNGHTDWVTAVAFSPDGRLALSGSRDRSVILWNVATGDVIRRDRGHNGTVIAVGFSPDGQHAYSACLTGATRLWPASSVAFIDWVKTHRYARELTCDERERYRLEPCDPG
jgi:WD40 repeat protein